MPKLRQLKFSSLDETIADIEQLRTKGYEQGGAWNLSQVCEHIAKTIHVGLHGDAKPAPWWLRYTLFKLLFEVITFMGSMPSGASAPPELAPEERAEDDPTPINECLALLAEARDRTEPLPPNPMVAGFPLNRWRRLQEIHAAHHLAFLKPK